MRQCARTVSAKVVKMPGLWARRLVEHEVVKLDVVESVMPEDVKGSRIYEAGPVEGRMVMSMAISTDGLVDHKDRRVDDALAEVAPMLSKMSVEVM